MKILALFPLLLSAAAFAADGQPASAPAAPAAAASAPAAVGAFEAAPAGASVDFVEPKNGAKVKGEFTVKFKVTGMMIHPAGALVPGTGHHHLIIDGVAAPAGEVVPADATHLHFGKGQTETKLKLAPGKHTLTLQFADGAHRSYGPALSKTIHVTAK